MAGIENLVLTFFVRDDLDPPWRRRVVLGVNVLTLARCSQQKYNRAR